MINSRLFLAQRISALILAPMVFIHLGGMIYAVQGGLSAAEILSRTQGSLFWGVFYGSFVLAAAVHGAIGIRVLIGEYLGLKGGILNLVSWTTGLIFVYLGMRAVMAVVLQ